MKKLLLGITACLALATTILVSCNKTGKEQNVPKTENLKKMSVRLSFYDFPKNENGLLVFRDQAHYDGYIDFLNVAVDSMDIKDTTIDINTVLQDIENGLGFTSIRKTSHEEYIRQDIVGWPSLEAIPDEHFILAQDIRSTLNTNLDVQIGTEILHYVSKDFAVRVDAGNKALLEQFKRLPTNISLSDITLIDPSRRGSSIIELTGDGFIFGRQKPTADNIAGPYISFPDKCNDPGKVRFTNLGLYRNNNSVEAYFKIDYGDGSAIEYKSSFGNYVTGFYVAPNFYHTYTLPASGSITHIMTITACENPNFPAGQTVTTQVPVPLSSAVNCSLQFPETDWQYYQIPGTNDYIGGKVKMQNVGNTNVPKLRMCAYSKLVRLMPSGNYKSFKGEMFIELTCDKRGVSNNCYNYGSMDGSGWDSHDDEQTLHRTSSNYTGWSLAKSKHGYKYNGTWYWKWIELRPCD
jgi:hypothetical protein